MANYYKEHVIAFIDILGFKEHIDKTALDAQHVKVVHDCLMYLSEVKKDNYEGDYQLNEITGKEVSIFSDSVVISYPLSNASSVFLLLIDIIHIQLELMAKGILIRGGITVGPLYHKDGVVYGPAMNEVYGIESKNAIYPRVVIDENVIIEGVKSTLHSPKEEFDYISSLMMIDEDKQLVIDYMCQYEEVDDMDTYRVGLEKIRKVIISEIDIQINPSILQKYIWLKKYFNRTMNKLGGNYLKELLIE